MTDDEKAADVQARKTAALQAALDRGLQHIAQTYGPLSPMVTASQMADILAAFVADEAKTRNSALV
jgi:hypothetical protein